MSRVKVVLREECALQHRLLAENVGVSIPKCKFVSVSLYHTPGCGSYEARRTKHDSLKCQMPPRHSRLELDFADGQACAGYRAGVECFIESPKLDEEMQKRFGKSIG